MDLPGVGPAGGAGHEVELAKKTADDLIGVLGSAQMIELFEDSSECALHVVHGGFGEVLTLLFETLLALDELLAVERRARRTVGLPDWKRVSEEAGYAMP